DALIPHSPPHFRARRSLDDRSRCVSRRGLTRRDRRAMLPSQTPPIPAAKKQQVGGSSPLASSLNTSSDNGLVMGGTRRLAWKWIAAAHDPPACQWRPPTEGFRTAPRCTAWPGVASPGTQRVVLIERRPGGAPSCLCCPTSSSYTAPGPTAPVGTRSLSKCRATGTGSPHPCSR